MTLVGLDSEIRRALGDSAQDSKFIRTVHGVGYAFCGAAADLPSFLAWERSDGHRPSTAALRPYRDRELTIPYAVYEVNAAY